MADRIQFTPEEIDQLTPEELQAFVAQEEAAGRSEHGVSTSADIAHGIVPWAAQAATGLRGTLGGLGDLALGGVEKLGEATGYDKLAGAAKFMREQNQPYTPAGRQQHLEKMYPNADLGYQPQTTGGQLVQAGESIIPSALLTSGAGVGPTLLRAGAATAGSVGGKNAAERYLPESWQKIGSPIAQMISALGGWASPSVARSVIAPNTAGALHEAQVAALRGAGVPVDTAQATRSGRLRSILGAPPAGQQEAISDAMMQQGGLRVSPGVHPDDAAQQLVDRLAIHRANLGSRFPTRNFITQEANAKGIKAGTNQMSASGQDYLDPKTIWRNITNEQGAPIDTPLKDFARSATAVTRPIEPKSNSGIASALGGALGYVGGGFAGTHGLGGFGAESPVLWGLAAGHAAGPILDKVTQGAQRAAVKSVPWWLENPYPRPGPYTAMDPQSAVRALSLEAAKRLPGPDQPSE